MVLFELYQVLSVSTEVVLFNKDCKVIFRGFLSYLSPETLGILVTYITPMSNNEIYIGIDTNKSEVK
ncbi:MAG: hypothetical protein J6F30_06195 [Cellulosilyticum sp.]|nr:hypothetical protein [Cellulosilyticum sp.]